jgi:integrase
MRIVRVHESSPYPFMSKFHVVPCQHGNARFRVDGRINGKRIRSFHRTKLQAEAECNARNVELFQHGQELASISASLRAEAIACQKRLDSLGASLTQAVDEYFARHDKRSCSVQVKDAWTACEAELERRVKGEEITREHLWGAQTIGRQFVKQFGQQYICDLTPPVISDWLVSLSVNPQTRKSYRLKLSGILTFAQRKGWIESNPISQVQAPSPKDKEPGILTPEQANTLLFACCEEILPSVAIGLFAGLRVAEINRLDWSAIHFEKRHVTVRAAICKTAQRRHVPMSDNLLAWLAPYRGSIGPVSPVGSKRLLCEARHKAGLGAWARDGKKNALRHSYCSYHRALSESNEQTSMRAGHSSTSTLLRHYTHLVEREDALRYFGIYPTQTDNIIKIA